MSENEAFCCWRPKEVNTRTHFCLGHAPYLFSTSYNKDYNWNAIRNHTQQGTLPVLASKKTPQVGCSKHKTKISFGNDAAVRTTTYQQVSRDSCYQSPIRAVSPPTEAEILPPSSFKQPPNSLVREDFKYFGPRVNRGVYDGRMGVLQEIKNMHTYDSVSAAMLGRRRKMMTRTMVDYQHPLERVNGNIKDFMVLQIAPSVRADSIWTSVQTGSSPSSYSENKANFTWPHSEKGMRRFYRGQMNKLR